MVTPRAVTALWSAGDKPWARERSGIARATEECCPTEEFNHEKLVQ